MKNTTVILMIAGLLLLVPAYPTGGAGSWPGVDEAVIEKVAEKAGRPSREPFINTDQGDLLLFLFLLAGISGGFIAGYNFRALFPPRRRQDGRGTSTAAENVGKEDPAKSE